jgi:hypothetical protein
MPSPLQQPSARRKLIYFGLILGLFVVNTFLWRGVASPLTGGQPPAWTVTSQANALELREENRGDVDLLGSTLRLGLTGSRGLAVTILWNAAIDKQMKHEWNELEFIVRSLTKLQPHFLTPWLFQSWNLSYNVSVESDRVRDKYFYISRGIELLAQGERLNRDNPDMRFWLGFYYLNKFGVSDEANTLRSLLQLSCIEPTQRDPALFRRAGGIDLAAFEEFCRKNPQLVRRLHEVLKYTTPADVVDFLADNRKVPTRFVDPALEAVFVGKAGDLKPADQQFPILPESKPVRFPSDEPTASDALGDSFDNYQAARAWFSYSQDPLPDPEVMVEIKGRAERMAGLKGRRLPRAPAEVIFRQYPARSQSFVGERLEKEGWFDSSGWAIDAGRSGQSRWFPGRDVVVGQGVNWAGDAWERAFQMWRDDGRRTSIYLEKTEETRLEELAGVFRKRYNIAPGDLADGFRPDALEPQLAQSLLAHRQLAFRNQNLMMTNFAHHYYKADAERDPQAVQARKLVFEAEYQRAKLAEYEKAIETYQKAFDLWKDLLSRERYRDFRNDSSTQEEIWEAQYRYLQLVREQHGVQLRPALEVQGVLREGMAGMAAPAFPGQTALGLLYGLVTDQRALPIPVLGPFDGTDRNGQAWVSPEVIQTVRTRLNFDLPPPPPVAPAPTAASPQPAAATNRGAGPAGR